jgi:ATP-dependent exoDNAse (exonuclease V) beta subunit
MSNKPLKDQAHRDKAAGDLGKSYIVEAAAGTGKTTLLVSRIMNLIKDKKALPEEIVAITFTERAAAELKMKLQDSLGTELLREPEREHLAEALWGLERMQVTTIHSFCASLIRERPVEAGVDPNFEVADELMASIVKEDLWKDWLAEAMQPRTGPLARALSIGITINHMQDLAWKLLENRDVLEYLPATLGWNPGEPGEPDEPDFRGTLEEKVEQLVAMARQSCGDPSDRASLLIEELKAGTQELNYLDRNDDLRAHLFNLSIPSPRNKGNKKNWATPECLKDVRAGLEDLRQAHISFKAWLAHNIIVDLAQALRAFVEKYERRMSDGAMLDFHDLLLYARDMLRDQPHVRDYFRSRQKYILVDEFQDTDPLQAEIIFFLSEARGKQATVWEDVKVSPGKLFLVGDPKQSIYRFRRADIEMYAAAKHGLGRGHDLSIFQNFRCVEPLINVVNSVFSDLIVAPPDGAYQPDYVALEFGRGQGKNPSRSGALLVYPPDSLKGEMETASERRTCEARTIAALIRKLVDGGNGNGENLKIWDKDEDRLREVMLKDIAILLRTHKPLDHIETALKLYKVDYRVIGGKHFFQRQEIRQLLAVLLAMDNPYDRVALTAALRSPFFGISDEDMFLFHAGGGELNYLRGAAGTPLEDAFALLSRLHGMRNEATVEDVLRELYRSTKATVVFLLKPGGEQRVHNLVKIGETARALAYRGVNTFRGFVRWLEERHDEEADEAEAATVEAGDNFVRVLTVHKAKGLEFPVVFLADLAGSKSEREPFIVDRRHRDIAMMLGGKDDGIQTMNYTELKDYELRRSEAEERRLLYVAMTRPRDLLVLPVYWSTPRELDKETGLPRPGQMLSYLADKIPRPEEADSKSCPEGFSIYPTAKLDLEPEEPPALRIKPSAKTPPVPRRVEKLAADWRSGMESFRNAIARGRGLRTATEQVEGERPSSESKVPGSSTRTKSCDGAAFGRLVHDLLERVDWKEPTLLEAIAHEEVRACGAPGKSGDSAVKMVKAALASDLVGRILKSDRYYKEVPFAFKECDPDGRGMIVEGMIDVVFEEGGDVSIVDFKTDKIPKGAARERADHYMAQVETYRKALAAACGRPPKEVILFFLHPMIAITLD